MFVSVLTATYNRGYILPELYDSLLRQSCKEFSWVIVDDGSSDNTCELVKKWIAAENNGFDITYYRKENGGKHTAINLALQHIDTEYTFLVDSDDKLTPDAIEKVKRWVATIQGDDSFAGVSGLRGYTESSRIGDYPDKIKHGGYVDASNLERAKYHLKGDKAEVYRTAILKKYPFPEFKGEKFLAETVVWDKIAIDGYKIRWFNDIIYTGNYLQDGLTQKIDEMLYQNPQGYCELIRVRLKARWMVRYRSLGGYYYFMRNHGENIRKANAMLGGGISLVSVIIGGLFMEMQRAYHFIFDRIRGTEA